MYLESFRHFLKCLDANKQTIRRIRASKYNVRSPDLISAANKAFVM